MTALTYKRVEETTAKLFWNRLERVLLEIQNMKLCFGALCLKSLRYREQIKILEQLVFEFRGTDLEKELLADSRFADYAAETRKLYEEYEVYDERRSRNQLMEAIASFGKPDPGSIDTFLLDMSPPIKRTYEYAFKEAEMAKFTPDSVYCHVGSGPFPETLMAMETLLPEGSLTGIDSDAKSLELGADLIRFLGRGENIIFQNHAGENVDYKPFSHIHLAVLVRPEMEVVEQICKTANKDREVTLLLRSAEGFGSLIYEPLSKKTEDTLAAHGFELVKTLRGHAIMQTRLYRRHA